MRLEIYRPPRGRTNESTLVRQKWVQEKTGLDFSETLIEKPEKLDGIIEQHLGYQTLPLAIASPLSIHGTHAQGTFMVPVCTVEGTLVYSLTRGMLATADSGGIVTQYLGQRISRAPLFVPESMMYIPHLLKFIKDHSKEIIETAESTTRYGKVVDVKTYVVHKWVVLELVFTTGNAAGQNMITIATKAACQYIQAHFSHSARYYLESGLNSDKKASRRIMAEGRGHSVIAETKIRKQVLRRLLGISTEQTLEFQNIGTAVSQVIGSFGSHLHIANAVTAVYLAMGQDVACVAENSVGNLHFSGEDEESLTIRLSTPSLTVGTIGGGTRLPSQQRNLELIGCHEGEFAAAKLAEITCATAMCLELSLFSAIITDTFAEAHKQYGRKQ